MRRIVLMAFLLAGAAAALFVASVLRGGVSARREPTAAEAFVARRLRHLAIPSNARDQPNPLPATPQTIAEGRAHFADHCATCHANDGGGDTAIGRGLYPKAPDMRRAETQSLSDGELFYIIKNGVRFTGMPAWGSDDPASDGSELEARPLHPPSRRPHACRAPRDAAAQSQEPRRGSRGARGTRFPRRPLKTAAQ